MGGKSVSEIKVLESVVLSGEIILNILKYISTCFVLMPTEMEEGQPSECAPAGEPGHLAAEQPQQFVRSSSTPDVTEPLRSEPAQGTQEPPSLVQSCRPPGKKLLLSTFILSIYFKGIDFLSLDCEDVISAINIFSLFT